MTMKAGQRMPEGTLLRMGENGPEQVPTGGLFQERRVVVFGLPGAFTGTCSTAHLPSYMRVRAQLSSRGVDEVVCVATPAPFIAVGFHYRDFSPTSDDEVIDLLHEADRRMRGAAKDPDSQSPS